MRKHSDKTMRLNSYWAPFGWYYDCGNETIWFVDYWSNLLCEYSLSDKSYKSLTAISSKTYNDQSCLYSDIKRIGDNLLLSPCNADNPVLYNISRKEFQTISIDGFLSGFNRYGLLELYNDSVYMFPYAENNICKIDLRTNMCCCVGLKITKNKIKDGDISLFQMQHSRKGNIVVFLSALSNEVYIFDMENENIKTIRVGDISDIFNTVVSLEDGNYLLSLQNGNFYIVDLINNRIVDRINDQSGIITETNEDERGPLYMDSVLHKRIVWNFPYQAKYIKGIDVESLEIKTIDLSPYRMEDYNERWQVAGFSMIEKTNSGFVGFWNRKGKLFVMSEDGKKIWFYDNRIGIHNVLAGDLRMLMPKGGLVKEQTRKFFFLEDFLELI